MRKATIGAVCAVLVLLGIVGGWTAVQAIQMLNGPNSQRGAALQAVAAATTLLTTVVLVAVTARYVLLTDRLVRQTGPDVSARLAVGYTDNLGGLVTGEPPLSITPPAGFDVPVLAIVVRNRGNAAVTVTRMTVELDTGVSYTEMNPRVGPSCPYRLDGQSSVNLMFWGPEMVNTFAALIDVTDKHPKRVRGVVELGTGSTVKTPWMVPPRS